MEAEGNKVTVCDRLGDTLTHKGNGQTPHKWVCVAWRQAEANATYSQVLLGDKGNGLKYYQGHEKGQKIDLRIEVGTFEGLSSLALYTAVSA